VWVCFDSKLYYGVWNNSEESMSVGNFVLRTDCVTVILYILGREEICFNCVLTADCVSGIG